MKIFTDQQKLALWNMVQLHMNRKEIIQVMQIKESDFYPLYQAARREHGTSTKKYIRSKALQEVEEKKFVRPKAVYSNPSYNN